MPYIVTNSDGSLTSTVADSTVDTSTFSLALIGRSVSNYGQYFAQNTIRHLENFASATAPAASTILEGQLWYNKTEKQLSVWQGTGWKRLGITVGTESERPTTYRTVGTAFYNTSTNKLEVYNDGWQEAGYAGLVTTAYASDTGVQSPTTYGTRLRTIFIREALTGNMIPVMAMCYVKSPTNLPNDPVSNRGASEVPTGSGNYETVMAFWSDFEFDVDSAGTNSPVGDGVVNYYPEFVPGNETGILDARAGKVAGRVYKGLNTRAEYEGTSSGTFDSLFVTDALGSTLTRVPDGFFTDINASGLIETLNLTVTGTATGTFADLAEKYEVNEVLEAGTVVRIGGNAEIQTCDTDADTEVFGVISTSPAYLMNAASDGEPVALQGRVPVKVTGIISKGDRLVSAGGGRARAIGDTPYDPRIIVGRALADKADEGEGVIEAVIGVK